MVCLTCRLNSTCVWGFGHLAYPFKKQADTDTEVNMLFKIRTPRPRANHARTRPHKYHHSMVTPGGQLDGHSKLSGIGRVGTRVVIRGCLAYSRSHHAWDFSQHIISLTGETHHHVNLHLLKMAQTAVLFWQWVIMQEITWKMLQSCKVFKFWKQL